MQFFALAKDYNVNFLSFRVKKGFFIEFSPLTLCEYILLLFSLSLLSWVDRKLWKEALFYPLLSEQGMGFMYRTFQIVRKTKVADDKGLPRGGKDAFRGPRRRSIEKRKLYIFSSRIGDQKSRHSRVSQQKCKKWIASRFIYERPCFIFLPLAAFSLRCFFGCFREKRRRRRRRLRSR